MLGEWMLLQNTTLSVYGVVIMFYHFSLKQLLTISKVEEIANKSWVCLKMRHPQNPPQNVGY